MFEYYVMYDIPYSPAMPACDEAFSTPEEAYAYLDTLPQDEYSSYFVIVKKNNRKEEL